MAKTQQHRKIQFSSGIDHISTHYCKKQKKQKNNELWELRCFESSGKQREDHLLGTVSHYHKQSSFSEGALVRNSKYQLF